MSKLREYLVIFGLKDLASKIHFLSVKMTDILDENLDLFSKEDLLEKIENNQDHIERLSKLSEDVDDLSVSDDEITNRYYKLYSEMNEEYLALKNDVLRRKIENKK